MDTVQKVTQGRAHAGKFDGLGVTGKAVKCHPRRAFGFVSGPPGTGKTRFFCSCDGAYIMNLDGSSTPVDTDEQMHAGMWPLLDEQGRTLDCDGKPLILTWEHVQEKVNKLKEAALANRPRPDLVVVDTLPSGLDLGMEYIVRRSGKGNWKDLHGPSAWDDLYNLFVELQFDLRRHGYGVYYICHIVNQYIQLGEQQHALCPGLTITDSFWKRLFRRLELSIVMRDEWYTSDLVQKTPGGQERVIKGKGPRVKKRVLTINDETYSGITKGRTDFQNIVLPEDGGWDLFEQAYLQ